MTLSKTTSTKLEETAALLVDTPDDFNDEAALEYAEVIENFALNLQESSKSRRFGMDSSAKPGDKVGSNHVRDSVSAACRAVGGADILRSSRTTYLLLAVSLLGSFALGVLTTELQESFLGGYLIWIGLGAGGLAALIAAGTKVYENRSKR